MSRLGELLEGIAVGEPVVVENLSIVPLRRGEGHEPALDYVLAADAFERGDLAVTEVNAEGVVAELKAVNSAEVAVLLLDGEELVGAKQNRILNTDVLLRAKGKATIPVSCVEQGRWRHDRPDFGSGGYAPSKLRGRKSRSVTDSLRRLKRATSDQGQVWQDVAAMHARLGTSSPTDAMEDAYRAREGHMGEYVSRITYAPDSVGVIAEVNGRFAALDLFDWPATLEKLWPRLIASYAVDALGERRVESSAPSDAYLSQFLAEISDTTCRVHPGVDLGDDWRFAGQKVVGSALVVDAMPVHLGVFPGDSDSGGGRIAGPRLRGLGR